MELIPPLMEKKNGNHGSGILQQMTKFRSSETRWWRKRRTATMPNYKDGHQLLPLNLQIRHRIRIRTAVTPPADPPPYTISDDFDAHEREDRTWILKILCLE
ncbi:hypothetical protein DM860_010810 [Cuscuta australis]|uniref:Uncharacterized protein n=1 Tax=Cuscuta australis TaxID=267555 RepID=A0A328E3Q7_9ASTE|nr:hypothetical protein DM860_010810 [Cuscuta australis]